MSNYYRLGSKRAVTSSPTNGARRSDERKRAYKDLRSPRPSDSGRGADEGSIPRRFRRGAGKYSQVLVESQKVSTNLNKDENHERFNKAFFKR